MGIGGIPGGTCGQPAAWAGHSCSAGGGVAVDQRTSSAGIRAYPDNPCGTAALGGAGVVLRLCTAEGGGATLFG